LATHLPRRDGRAGAAEYIDYSDVAAAAIVTVYAAKPVLK
jgi:hypothetical protein